jgi:hypothetical protein
MNESELIIDGRPLDAEYARELADKFEHAWTPDDYDTTGIEYSAKGVLYRSLKALNFSDATILEINDRAQQSKLSPEVYLSNVIHRELARTA